MRTLVVVNSIGYSTSQFFLFRFPSVSREKRKLLHISYRDRICNCNPKSLRLSSFRAHSTSELVSYGGWDELRLGCESGESTQLRDFLVSIGIDDKRHVFMFLLGFVCALAISRVRVSSIVVFPASVLIFAIGFSLGFVRGTGGSVSASKRKSKDEFSRTYSEKLRHVLDFFNGFDFKINNLKNYVRRAIDSNEVASGDLENYVNEMESIRLLALNARNVVTATIDNGLLVENQKPSSRRRKDLGEVGLGLSEFVGGLFGEKLVDSKPNKVKDNIKQGNANSNSNSIAIDQTQGNFSSSAVEAKVLDFDGANTRKENSKFSQDLSNKSALDRDGGRRIKVVSEDGEMKPRRMGGSVKRSFGSEEYGYENNIRRFMNNCRSFSQIGSDNGSEAWDPHDSVDFSVSLKHMETEASFIQERMLKKSSGFYRSSHSRGNSGNESLTSQFREGGGSYYGDSHSADYRHAHDSEVGSSSSSMFLDDVAFDRYLTEANDLLKHAKECIRGRNDEEHAEIILYKSAKLLSKAIAMKPMSLLAAGQLGNTYLLHGELKLKISRELRTLLLGTDPVSLEKLGGLLKGLDDQTMSKDKIASVLVDVCEECEELLVEAGRKYRLALSIDGNDVRALYNWGLALSFRAQLIADIGPEAAFDADKVFLAAIDKFDAMMSKGNIYAPDALFRWGVALQQRSRLRPSNSKEEIKLLQQAKRLYEDALHMDSDNFQVREALSSCLSELNDRHF